MLFNFNINPKPTTVYAILESICNYGKNEVIKTTELAKNGRGKIFDFNYPLTKNIKKEDFETNILNHFLMRRIGFETITAFKIQLNVKLNEIMPIYNKMFDFMEGWDIFNDGEEITREFKNERQIDFDGTKKNTGTNTMENTGTETLKNTGTNTIENTGTETLKNTGTNTIESDTTKTNINTNDNRRSDMPQSEIENVQNADYLTRYTLTSDEGTNTDKTNKTETLNTENKTTLNTENKNTLNTENKTTLDTKNTNTQNLTETNNNNTNDNIKINETITKSPADKMKLYQQFIENRNNIYTMIYKDLDCLFYQLI